MDEPRHSRVAKRRPAKACNTCRRKKVKCDGKRPICSSCMIFKLPCGFEDTGSQPTSRSTRAYVEDLEERIKQMDEQLQQLRRGESLPRPNSRESQTPANITRPSRLDRSGSEESIFSAPRAPDEGSCSGSPQNSDQPSYFLRAHDGKMRFFGASSGFGIHCSRGASQSRARRPRIAWGNVARRSATQWPLTNWVPRILQDSFEKRITQPLPSRETTMALVAEFRATFNQVIPLVNDTSLTQLVERHFSWNPDESPSSWVLINVILAFSYRERAQSSTHESSDYWRMSLGHIKNALNVLVDLFLRNADLPAVQGLLGLAIYFQGTPNAQALFMLAASAMRLAHSIGLHRNTMAEFNQSEIEERRRTFWVAFILDADISMRVGRPPVQDMEDYSTPLPAEMPHDGRGIISIHGTDINFFRLLTQFAIVQRRVYRHLQTVVVTRQPKERALESAEACEKALLQWRYSFPDVLQPQHSFPSEAHYAHQHVLRLYLAYYCCYAALRQLPLVASSGPHNLRSQEHLSEVDKDITALCLRSLASARSALRFLPHLRLLGPSHKWNVLYFFATVSVALLSEIRINPTHGLANDDSAMAHETIEFLTAISHEEPGTYVDFILSVCSDLEISASRALHEARGDRAQRAAPTGIDDNVVDIPDNIDPTAQQQQQQQQYADYVDNNGILSNNDPSMLLTDLNGDFLNLQWSIPPFWNWQDMVIGVPDSPEINRRTDGLT